MNRHLGLAGDFGSMGVVVLTSSVDQELLVSQRIARNVRIQLMEREAAGRRYLETDMANILQRMLHHFNIEKRIFAETDLTMCIYDERARRAEITRSERSSFDRLSAAVLSASVPELLVLAQVQHARKACYIWLAQSLGRAEIIHRMNAVVKEELLHRRALTQRLHASLGETAAAATTGAAAGAARLQQSQRTHESQLSKLDSLRADRTRGILAAKVHALLSAHQAARTRLIWEEEIRFRNLLRFW